MMNIEEKSFRRFSGLHIIYFSLALGVVGILPFFLNIWFGPEDGNPIGLGLMMVVSVPVVAGGILLGLIKMIIEYFIRRKET